jgi:hypothetical protein
VIFHSYVGLLESKFGKLVVKLKKSLSKKKMYPKNPWFENSFPHVSMAINAGGHIPPG